MGEWLKAKGVTEVFVCGLATDYCVKFTALDAVQMGFKTHLIEDACRGVNLQPDDVKSAVEEMKRAGVAVGKSDELRPEYDLAALRVRRMGPDRKQFGDSIVRLEPDVSEVFPDANSVNEALRFLIRVAKEKGSPKK